MIASASRQQQSPFLMCDSEPESDNRGQLESSPCRNQPSICRSVDLRSGWQGCRRCGRGRSPWRDNSRRNGGDGTTGYCDLGNPGTSVRPFVEVNSHSVGYYFGGV